MSGLACLRVLVNTQQRLNISVRLFVLDFVRYLCVISSDNAQNSV